MLNNNAVSKIIVTYSGASYVLIYKYLFLISEKTINFSLPVCPHLRIFFLML